MLLISPEDLATPSSDPPRVIVDCRFSLADPQWGYRQYLAGHIPHAYYLDLNRDLSGVVQSHGGRHPLPDIPTLAAKLSQMGVTAQTQVVAYDDSRFAFAARLWWLLRYMGHERAAVLDGGFSAYQAAGLPITATLPSPQAGTFVPRLDPTLVVDRIGVQNRQGNPQVALVDAREPERYRGEREPIDPVAGHIPGAVNYPWQQVTNEAGRLRSPQFLRHHWSAIAAAEEVVVYCGSGVTACVNLLAMEAAGFPKGKLYVGSWSDWCSDPANPIHTIKSGG